MKGQKVKGGVYKTMYSGIQIAYWMDFAVIATFSAVFLGGLGFDSIRIGYITTIAALLGIILQPLMAQIADNSEKITIRMILLAAIGIGIICAAILANLSRDGAAAFVFAFTVIALTSSVQPLIGAYCLRLNKRGLNINLGISRALGSLGYSAGGYLMGTLTHRFGPGVILPVFCGILAVVFILLLCMPPERGDITDFTADAAGNVSAASDIRGRSDEDTAVAKGSEKSSSILEFFRRYRRFDIFLIAIIFTHFMQILQNTYLIYFVRHFGGNESHMGSVVMLMAAAEIPMIALSVPVMKRISAGNMLRIFGIFNFLQFALMLVIPNIQFYIAIQLMHFLSTGMYQVSSVYFANEIVGGSDMVKGQAIIGAAINGVTAVAANILGGYMIADIPIKATVAIGSALCLAGTVIIFICTDERRYRKQ